MRVAGFWVGVLLIVMAAATGVAQLLAILVQPAGGTVSIGSIWAGLDADSLVGFQGLVENKISPALWPPIQTWFIWPAWLTLGLPGVLLTLIGRPRGRRFEG